MISNSNSNGTKSHSILSKPLSTLLKQMSEEPDFLRIFEDEDFGGMLQQSIEHIGTFSRDVPSVPKVTGTNMERSIKTVTSGRSCSASTCCEFVNVVLIVNPITRQVCCPQQTLIHNSQKAVIGPAVLDGFPIDTIDGLSQEFQRIGPNGQDRAPGCATSETGGSQEIPLQTPSPVTQSQYHVKHPSPCILRSKKSRVSQTLSQAKFDECVSSGTRSLSPLHIDHITIQSASSVNAAPLRALSAYNFFFRDERHRLLHGGDHDWSNQKRQALLNLHWRRDRAKKRKHRRTHGKIDFTTLSKCISQRWRDLSEEGKDFYRDIATADWQRYQQQVNHIASFRMQNDDSFLPADFSSVMG
jgi:hypothetical protein